MLETHYSDELASGQPSEFGWDQDCEDPSQLKQQLKSAMARIDGLESQLHHEITLRVNSMERLGEAEQEQSANFDILSKHLDTEMKKQEKHRRETLDQVRKSHSDAMEQIQKRMAESEARSSDDMLTHIKRIHDLEAQNTRLKYTNRDLNAVNSHICDQVKESEARNLKEFIELHNVVSESKKQVLEYRHGLETLQGQNDILKSTARMLHKQRKEVLSEAETLKSELAMVTELKDEYLAEMKELREDRSKITQNHRGTERKLNLPADIQHEQAASNELTDTRARSGHVKEVAVSQLEAVQLSLAINELELTKARQSLSRCKVQLTDLQECFEMEQKKLARVRNSAENDRELLRELREKYRLALEKNQSIREQNFELNGRIDHLESRLCCDTAESAVTTTFDSDPGKMQSEPCESDGSNLDTTFERSEQAQAYWNGFLVLHSRSESSTACSQWNSAHEQLLEDLQAVRYRLKTCEGHLLRASMDVEHLGYVRLHQQNWILHLQDENKSLRNDNFELQKLLDGFQVRKQPRVRAASE